MTIKSILVPTDLSAEENAAVLRAGQLADTHRATVTLMYMPVPGQQVPADAANRLANAARQLEESLERRVKAVPVKAHKPSDFDPPSELEVLHALSTLEEAKLRSAEATEEAVRAFEVIGRRTS